jgi:hypothetical protein
LCAKMQSSTFASSKACEESSINVGIVGCGRWY